MNAICRQVLNWAIGSVVLAAVAGCAGTTSVQPAHPAVVAGGAVDRARVYFIRPDPGFRGVMDRPLTISLGGAELLSLAKGQYTLVALAPGNTELKVDSLTVVGLPNTMTPVSTTTPLTFQPQGTHFLVFQMVLRGVLAGSVFVPRQVSKERAIETVRGLTPVGMAIAEPIQ